jgi:hypothetical protein
MSSSLSVLYVLKLKKHKEARYLTQCSMNIFAVINSQVKGMWNYRWSSPPGCFIPGTHWIGGWVGPRTVLEDMERRKISPLPGLELQHVCRPACSQSLYRWGIPAQYLARAMLNWNDAEWTPFQTHYFSENLVAPGIEPGTSGSVVRSSDH